VTIGQEILGKFANTGIIGQFLLKQAFPSVKPLGISNGILQRIINHINLLPDLLMLLFPAIGMKLPNGPGQRLQIMPELLLLGYELPLKFGLLALQLFLFLLYLIQYGPGRYHNHVPLLKILRGQGEPKPLQYFIDGGGEVDLLVQGLQLVGDGRHVLLQLG